MHEQSQHYLNKKVAAALSNQVEKPHQETSMIASMKIIHVWLMENINNATFGEKDVRRI